MVTSLYKNTNISTCGSKTENHYAWPKKIVMNNGFCEVCGIPSKFVQMLPGQSTYALSLQEMLLYEIEYLAANFWGVSLSSSGCSQQFSPFKYA